MKTPLTAARWVSGRDRCGHEAACSLVSVVTANGHFANERVIGGLGGFEIDTELASVSETCNVAPSQHVREIRCSKLPRTIVESLVDQSWHSALRIGEESASSEGCWAKTENAVDSLIEALSTISHT